MEIYTSFKKNILAVNFPRRWDDITQNIKKDIQNNKNIIKYYFKTFNPIGAQELYAAPNVIKSGKLSGFLGVDIFSTIGGFIIFNLLKNIQNFKDIKIFRLNIYRIIMNFFNNSFSKSI